MRVIFLCSLDGAKILRTAQVIRLDCNFRGTIFILSFTPQSWAIKQPGGEVIETTGCSYLQLPILSNELRALLTPRAGLSDEEMTYVRKKLSARRIFQAASSLRHDYENKFSLAFTHLRSVEKLSYFTPPDAQRVAKEVRGLKAHLSREKVERFSTEVTALLTAAVEWRNNRSCGFSSSLESQWNQIEAWLQLSSMLTNEVESEMSEIFIRAKRLETALRKILAVVTALKEEAQQVMNHA
jgi:hypothetical protein